MAIKIHKEKQQALAAARETRTYRNHLTLHGFAIRIRSVCPCVGAANSKQQIAIFCVKITKRRLLHKARNAHVCGYSGCCYEVDSGQGVCAWCVNGVFVCGRMTEKCILTQKIESKHKQIWKSKHKATKTVEKYENI